MSVWRPSPAAGQRTGAAGRQVLARSSADAPALAGDCRGRPCGMAPCGPAKRLAARLRPRCRSVVAEHRRRPGANRGLTHGPLARATLAAVGTSGSESWTVIGAIASIIVVCRLFWTDLSLEGGTTSAECSPGSERTRKVRVRGASTAQRGLLPVEPTCRKLGFAKSVASIRKYTCPLARNLTSGDSTRAAGPRLPTSQGRYAGDSVSSRETRVDITDADPDAVDVVALRELPSEVGLAGPARSSRHDVRAGHSEPHGATVTSVGSS